VAYLIVSGGLSAALIQQKGMERRHLETGMSLALIAGLLLAVLTLLVAGLVVTPIFGATTGIFVALMAPLCVVSALNVVPTATLSRRMAFRRLSEIEMLNAVARVIVCIGLAIIGLEGEALVIGVLVGSSVAAAVAWISAPPPLPSWDSRAARELL